VESAPEMAASTTDSELEAAVKLAATDATWYTRVVISVESAPEMAASVADSELEAAAKLAATDATW